MSQPHPPIPEPQPHPGDGTAGGPPADGPRTQSILLPPSQRQPERPASSPGQALPGQPAPPPSTSQFTTGRVDFVPGLPERPADLPGGSSATGARPPSTGPVTTPGPPPSPTSSAASSSSSSSAPSARPPAPHRSPLAALRRGPRGGAAVLALGLGVLGLAALELGLSRDFGSQSLWEAVPTWSALATVAALVVLVSSVATSTGRVPARTAWRAGAAGLTALAVFWVLVALPLAASDRGFWLTAALALAAGALWLAPGRTE
jgi:hypothetical protein